MTVLKTFLHPNGMHRVLIFRNDDGTFGYEVEKLVSPYDPELAERLNDFSKVWIPTRSTVTICGSEEEAEREARGANSWLAESED